VLRVGHPLLVLVKKEDSIILLSGAQKVDGGVNFYTLCFTLMKITVDLLPLLVPIFFISINS
jgi:hypothetical protein